MRIGPLTSRRRRSLPRLARPPVEPWRSIPRAAVHWRWRSPQTGRRAEAMAASRRGLPRHIDEAFRLRGRFLGDAGQLTK